jgi:hypothetical protein
MQYRPYYFKLSVRWYRAYSGIEQSFQSHFVISHSIFIYLLYKYIYKYINILYLYYVNIKRYSHCPQTQSITVSYYSAAEAYLFTYLDGSQRLTFGKIYNFHKVKDHAFRSACVPVITILQSYTFRENIFILTKRVYLENKRNVSFSRESCF